MTTHNGETFENLEGAMHHKDVFEGCIFQGYARRCNFSKATFDENCEFQGDFSFQSCNLIRAEGVVDVPKTECSYMTEEDWQTRAKIEAARMPGMDRIFLDDDDE